MIFFSRYQIEKSVMPRPKNDDDRAKFRHFLNVWFDAEKQTLSATNGKILSVVPCEAETGDVSGWVEPEIINAARKNKLPPPMADFARIRLPELQQATGDNTYDRPIDIEPPNYDAVAAAVRPGDIGTFSLCIDAELLSLIAKSLDAGGGQGVILTGVIGDAWAPISVVPLQDAFIRQAATLMPMLNNRKSPYR